MKTHKHLVTLPLMMGLALACLWLMVLPYQAARAATFTVNTDIDELDGSCSDGDCSLRDAIQTAVAGDTIDFDLSLSGHDIILTLGQLEIDKDLTLDGSTLDTPVRINGNNNVRVLFIPEGSVVSLSYVSIISGTGDSAAGGGIYNEADLTLAHCSLLGNSSTLNGGGIYNSGTIRVNDCYFVRNTAGYGGAIRNEHHLSITGSSFTDNFAEWGGGIDNYAGDMFVETSAFYSNTATYGGGGVTSGATLVVTGSTFTGNSADSGGAIENHNYAYLTVENSGFYSNTSSGIGGGMINLDGFAEVISSTLAGNTARGGAGIGNYATLMLSEGRFTRNSVTEDGGAILNQSAGSALIRSSSFSQNSAFSELAGYGGAIENYGALRVENSDFISNTARFNGGAIENWDATLIITGSNFFSNTAIAGGGIVNNTSSLLRITGSTFRENSSEEGGGILNDNLSRIAVTGSAFYSNTADFNGGGIFNLSGPIAITDTVFTRNASSYGGGIRNDAPMTLTLTTFYSNTADFGGGVHNVVSGQLSVDRSTFAANRTLHYGAGIYNNARMMVRRSTFMENSGDAGGGIYNDRMAHITNSTIYSNTVTGAGGGIINNSGTLTLTTSTLDNNSALAGGGLASGATLFITNTIIANSRSGGDCLSSGAIVANANNLVEDSGCDATFSGDPGVYPLADNGGSTWTCSLRPDSQAIDMGDSASCSPTDQRGEMRDDWNCDIGAFELKLTDSTVVTKTITGTGVYTFGPTRVMVEVVELGMLSSLSTARVSGDHPGRTGTAEGNGVGWGEYFTLTPNSGANETFNLLLTLPALFPPDANDKACRYINEYAWDCAADSFAITPFNTVTRVEVAELSDWAVGNDVSPTAIRLTSLRAIATGRDRLLLLFGAGLAFGASALIATLWRRNRAPRRLPRSK